MTVRVALALALLLPACSAKDAGAPSKLNREQRTAADALGEAQNGVDAKAAGGGAAADAPAVPPKAGEAKPEASRVVIYTATLALYVDSIPAVETALPALLDRFGAYLGESSVSRYGGSARLGHWVIRVPAERYRELLTGLSGLGTVQSTQSKAEDVTAAFVDLSGRLATQQALASRLTAILAQQTGKLAEVLEVERELARVRGGIEQIEGQLRLMKNQAALSTITLDTYERHDFEALPDEPTLVDRVQWAWRESLHAAVSFVKGALVLGVRVVPWVPILAAIGFALRALKRFWSRRRARARATKS